MDIKKIVIMNAVFALLISASCAETTRTTRRSTQTGRPAAGYPLPWIKKDCDICHLPPGAYKAGALKKKLSQLCLDCHRDRKPPAEHRVDMVPSMEVKGLPLFDGKVDVTAREGLSALFAPWGASPEVPERDLEAYAILTGMGPTYYWYQWQALRDVAVQFGLAPEWADDALRQMLDGAAATLLEGGLTPAAVMDLIPVRPLQAIEESVTAAYSTALPALYAKIRPMA